MTKNIRQRWDAEALAHAEDIKADPVRLSAAKMAAAKLAEEKRKELSGINKVARKAKPAKTRKYSQGKRQSGNTSFNVFEKI